MYDLLIKNGTVIDGTGAPRRQADVAVADGKIAEIGKVKDGASKVIDAAGCVVAPGFIDPHTHYDAQICWDPAISPSSWHGVTSVVMGNCGVGIAPCRPEAREVATLDLVNVEGIPFEVLNRGISWDWQTFPEFLDAAAKRELQHALPFAMEPVVYDFAINENGTMADLLEDQAALMPHGYYALAVPGLQSTQFPTAPKGWVVPGDPGIPSTLAHTRYNNFGPRLCLAYSPDFNPIEQAIAKLKAHLRKAQERSIDGLCLRIGKLIDLFQPQECANFFANSGYART